MGKREIARKVKTQAVKKVVRATFLYVSEVWTLHERIINMMNAMELRYLRKTEITLGEIVQVMKQ